MRTVYLLLLLSGCSIKQLPFEYSDSHPASPNAPQAPVFPIVIENGSLINEERSEVGSRERSHVRHESVKDEGSR